MPTGATMKEKSKAQDELDAIVKELAGKYGYSVAYKASDVPLVNVERIPTGSLALDVELGGGLPTGRMVELYGEESSGKSTMALKTIANVQKMGRRAVYIDLEHTFDREWAKILGVDLETLILSTPETAEQAMEVLEAVVRSGKCGIVVLDSIAALNPQSELDKSLVDDSAKIGERALLLSRVMPRLQSALNTPLEDGMWNNCLILFINQIRMKIGVFYGDPTTTPGGQAVKFACSVRVKLTHGAWVEGKSQSGEDVKIGHTPKFLVKKNKTWASGRAGEFTIYFDGDRKGQIDLEDEIMRYGQIYNVVELSGKTYKYGDLKAVGKAEFVGLLRENPKVVDSIRKEILKIVARA